MKKSARGFTLIEMIVVLTITGLLFAVGLARYQAFNQRQVLTQAAAELKNNLRLAQEKALAGDKPAGFCAASSLKGYRLIFTTVTAYQIRAICSDDSFQTIKTYPLPANMAGVSDSKILFKVLGQGTDATNTSVTFPLIYNGQTKNVVVTNTGKIE